MQTQETAIIQEWRKDKDGNFVPFVFCHVCGLDLTGKRALDIYRLPNGSFSRELEANECLCDDCSSADDFRVAKYRCNTCGKTFFIGENSSIDPTESIEARNHLSRHLCPDCNPKNKRIYVRTHCTSCNKRIIQALSPSEQERRNWYSSSANLCKSCKEN